MAIRLEWSQGGREAQDALLDLLNSTPVIGSDVEDRLADPGACRQWQREHGGTGGDDERSFLLAARDTLMAVIRGEEPATALTPLLGGVVARPRVTGEGVGWEVEAAGERRLAVEMIAAYGAVQAQLPGRLRACANPECRLFLIDRSKANSARWCSMAVCGNRMKARAHYQKARGSAG